ncbi:hypothetical protein E3T28_14840 [Cryobacterium sinapicolor]|uniref:Uncharacterized protein n=1 Tax=Cryobacterium sinapicolor TaxID=1259236 RepID=A0ABY2ITN4_9MICO|nr:hypothetical protein [Cryobacterium sinapicolor]TFC94576.1 hypothetical protein E3T28_14840 [Cryobacterium sinapicolor]
MSDDILYIDTAVDGTDPNIALMDGTADPTDSTIMMMYAPTFVPEWAPGTTITYPGGAIRPYLVLGFEAHRANRNIVHTLLDSSNPAVTLRSSGLMTGALNLLFLTHADARACDLAHKTAAVFTFADTDLPAGGFQYVPIDETTIQLDPGGSSCWTVAVPFQEVAA